VMARIPTRPAHTSQDTGDDPRKISLGGGYRG